MFSVINRKKKRTQKKKNGYLFGLMRTKAINTLRVKKKRKKKKIEKLKQKKKKQFFFLLLA